MESWIDENLFWWFTWFLAALVDECLQELLVMSCFFVIEVSNVEINVWGEILFGFLTNVFWKVKFFQDGVVPRDFWELFLIHIFSGNDAAKSIEETPEEDPTQISQEEVDWAADSTDFGYGVVKTKIDPRINLLLKVKINFEYGIIPVSFRFIRIILIDFFKNIKCPEFNILEHLILPTNGNAQDQFIWLLTNISFQKWMAVELGRLEILFSYYKIMPMFKKCSDKVFI